MAGIGGGLFTRGVKRPAVKVCEELLVGVYGSGAQVLPLGGEVCDAGRHLHTDALGVCNMLTVWYWNGKPRALLDQARGLVDEVHDVLGRARPAPVKRKKGVEVPPPPRLTGASEHEPLVGGLRCGRVMSEARPHGDGQVWALLMYWAFALNRLAVATDLQEYNHLAAQLVVCTALRFLQRALPEGEGSVPAAIEGAVEGLGSDTDADAVVAAPPASPPDGVSAWNFSPRMAIDLSRPLPAPERASDAIIGALVCGIVRSSLGPRGDAKIKQSLDGIERRLLQLWNATSDEAMARLMADPMQVGDLLWAGSWGANRKWGGLVGEVARDAVEAIVRGDGTPLDEQPLATRHPPGELWMAAGARNFQSGGLKSDTRDALKRLVDYHGKRLTLWGPVGKMSYQAAAFGGVFEPHYVSECNDIAYEARNNPAAFTGSLTEEDVFKQYD
eukprot:TRINITY_DN16799_c0_g1_i1.p2 TRINITY_DN16799_c0_g1~~TRINITY_DN16799_c0_g1_i1.p2  ORF type:complete len:461 (+),score=161.16 TRINITY_DN16799_c0_g1_i1:52-1383(+)